MIINPLNILFLIMVIFPLQSFADNKMSFSPKTVEGATTIDATQAKELFDQEALFIDTRKDSDWNEGRIPDAIHLDAKKKLTQGNLAKYVSINQKVVFYCNGSKCMRSSNASKMAIRWGYKNVYYFRDGFPEWKNSGYPIE